MNKLQELELEEIEDILERAEGIEEAEGGRFKIKDLESANWALRKLKAIEDKGKEITALANSEIERILEWKDGEIKQLGDSKDFFDFLLTEYYTEQKALDPKFKLSTPYGKVSSIKQQDNIIYGENIVEEIETKSLGKYLRVKTITEIDKTEFKKALDIKENIVTLNGEIVQNVEPYTKPFSEDSSLFVNVETGELYDTENFKYHRKAIVIDGKVIEGITVEERPDTVTIKVIE